MINVKDLEFTYPGNNEKTIKGLSFSIARGEVFGFLGPSGAGKSTTQKIIIGILKNYKGQVSVFDNELSGMGPDYYERVGVAFEFPNLYTKFTAMENLDYFKAMYKGETAEPESLLELVGLMKDARTRVSDYSKGMKMRLNLCRALLNNPDILFLDEPTSGLDPVNAKKVREIILSKKEEGKTVFMTTHNMYVADEICDRVAFIVDGKLSLIDSPRELKLKNGKKVVKIEYRFQDEIRTSEFEVDGLGENTQFQEIVKNNCIETIHSQEATLEDVFIRTTGRKLL
ncbi:ABC transporter ATP-binding protein [bacterium]|nr:ABC transporter ATP-binding protein [bacterium]